MRPLIWLPDQPYSAQDGLLSSAITSEARTGLGALDNLYLENSRETQGWVAPAFLCLFFNGDLHLSASYNPCQHHQEGV